MTSINEFPIIDDPDLDLFYIIRNLTFKLQFDIKPQSNDVFDAFFHQYTKTKKFNCNEFITVCQHLIYSENFDNIFDFFDNIPQKFKIHINNRILMRIFSYFVSFVSFNYLKFSNYQHIFEFFIARNIKPDDKWINYIDDIDHNYLLFLHSKNLIQLNVFSKLFYFTNKENNLNFIISKISSKIDFNHMKFSFNHHPPSVYNNVLNFVFINIKNYEFYYLIDLYFNDIDKINFIISKFNFPSLKSDFINYCFNTIISNFNVHIIKQFYLDYIDHIIINNNIIITFIISHSDSNNKLNLLFDIHSFKNFNNLELIEKSCRINTNSPNYTIFLRKLGGL